MIKSFRCRETEKIHTREGSRKFKAIERVAQRKLAMLHAAKILTDLKVPPNNKLEALKNDRAGQHAIRVNDQFRVCFFWKDGDAFNVEIVDYH